MMIIVTDVSEALSLCEMSVTTSQYDVTPNVNSNVRPQNLAQISHSARRKRKTMDAPRVGSSSLSCAETCFKVTNVCVCTITIGQRFYMSTGCSHLQVSVKSRLSIVIYVL
jgi:hypothetical protein